MGNEDDAVTSRRTLASAISVDCSAPPVSDRTHSIAPPEVKTLPPTQYIRPGSIGLEITAADRVDVGQGIDVPSMSGSAVPMLSTSVPGR